MLSLVAQGYAYSGRRREAQEYIDRMKEMAKTRYVRTYWLARIYAALGEIDKSFAELEQAFADKDIFLPRMKLDPMLDSLRDDPRFKDMLRRMDLPE
jgi:ribosomal protein L20